MYPRSEIKLLLVEDHFALREMMLESLHALNYPVLAYESSEKALASTNAGACHIALLDINLPGENGLYLAQQLRLKNPNIGIILLTVRNQLADKLEGYKAGADLYLPKPVAPEELDAAIQALCRRIPSLQQADLILHHATQQISNTLQASLRLSPEDCRLLTVLVQASQSRLEYWELAEHLSLDLDSETLRSNLEKRVSRLRCKLTQLGQPSTAIKALRGYGYQLTCSVQII